ncbi:MAG: hypothetical protein AAFP82_12430, partial [Bacteroidota bacterium]
MFRLKRLLSLLYLIIILFVAIIFSNCSGTDRDRDRDRDRRNYNSEEFVSNQQYSKENEKLTYDLYRPEGVSAKIPLIIFLPSGGFMLGDK